MHLGYVIHYVPDVLATVAFYERAFGVRRRFVHETQFAELETGPTALAFVDEVFASASVERFRRHRPEDSAAGTEVAFVDADVAGRYATAVAAGAVAVLEPTEKPWGQTVAYVRDLNGCLVEICSPVAVS